MKLSLRQNLIYFLMNPELKATTRPIKAPLRAVLTSQVCTCFKKMLKNPGRNKSLAFSIRQEDRDTKRGLICILQPCAL